MPQARDHGAVRAETIPAIPSRRTMLAGIPAALAAGAASFAKPPPLPWRGGPRPVPMPGDDAELIALCDRLVAWEATYNAIYLNIADDDEANAAVEAMHPEYEAIKARLHALAAPVTPEGQRAFARAAVACAPRGADGNVLLDTGGLGAYLAFGLAHALAGECAA